MHLEKNPNGIWYCRFKQNERWLRTSLRTSNKRQAQRKLSNLDLGVTQRERLAEASQRWLREQETRFITEKHLRDLRHIAVEIPRPRWHQNPTEPRSRVEAYVVEDTRQDVHLGGKHIIS